MFVVDVLVMVNGRNWLNGLMTNYCSVKIDELLSVEELLEVVYGFKGLDLMNCLLHKREVTT